MKPCFVILHYQNEDVTNNCINRLIQLKKRQRYKFDIVVVDNGSTNNSGKRLEQAYAELGVNVIRHPENVGFSRGNNIGYKYARNVLHADVIISMNSDVMIIDDDFLTTLNELIIENSADILAPDIITSEGHHQNPARNKQISKYETMQRIVQVTLLYSLTFLPPVFALVHKLNSRKKACMTEEHVQLRIQNIVPHGACIIVLKRFITSESELFDPDTFLFLEEELLYEKAKRSHYTILYVPELKVLHLEDASINASVSKLRLRKRFIAKEKLKSLKILWQKLR